MIYITGLNQNQRKLYVQIENYVINIKYNHIHTWNISLNYHNIIIKYEMTKIN